MADNAGAPNAAGGPNAPPHQPYSNKRLQQTQAQVDEVVDIMRVNVDKVLERDQKLSELDDRADQLQVQSRQFQTVTNKIRRKYFWQNIKMWIIIIGVVVVILVVIIVWVVSGQKPAPPPPAPPATASIQPPAVSGGQQAPPNAA